MGGNLMRLDKAGPVTLLATGLAVAGNLLAQEPTNPAAAAVKTHIMTTPEEIKWGSCSPWLPPGAKCAAIEGDPKTPNVLFAYRMKMPDNYRIAAHFHPADEHLVVILGTFNMGLGDKLDPNATRPMTAGSFMVMPKGTHHFAWTKGETIVQIYGIGPWGFIYVNPADDPRGKR
jgi:mannose-6-phosphate isomerase-like protein (cupin superfamily)